MLEVTLVSVFFNVLCTLSLLLSINHRVIEWLGLEGTLRAGQPQLPAVGRAATHHLMQPRVPSNLALSISGDGAPTASLGSCAGASPLGQVIFIIFISELDSGIEGSLRKFVDNPKLSGAIDTTEGRDTIQWNRSIQCTELLLIKPKLSDSTIKKVFFSTRISSSCCCFCVVWVSTWCELLTRCGVFLPFFFLLPRSILEIVSFFSPQLLFLLVPVNMCSISVVSWIRSITNKTQVQQNLHNLAAREVIRRSLLYLNAITPD